MENLDKIKAILESDAGFLIEDVLQPTLKTIVDNRFLLIKKKC